VVQDKELRDGFVGDIATALSHNPHTHTHTQTHTHTDLSQTAIPSDGSVTREYLRWEEILSTSNSRMKVEVWYMFVEPQMVQNTSKKKGSRDMASYIKAQKQGDVPLPILSPIPIPKIDLYF